ncbi:hypothetical protein V2J09_015552 [Rumex salicifolius]
MACYHTRSNSLPTTQNLFVSELEEHLSRLRSSESASSTSITSKIALLNDLYDSIDEFLQLPSSAQEKVGENTLLEGSIKLLDVCSTINDVMVQMKESIQRLHSIVRRRLSKDEVSMEVAEYLKSRKAAMKAVSKALKEMKKAEIGTGPKASAVSKLFKSKKQVDCFLVGIEAKDAILHAENKKTESNIVEVENGVERLFRQLIKTRATILNILNC